MKFFISFEDYLCLNSFSIFLVGYLVIARIEFSAVFARRQIWASSFARRFF